MNAQGIETIPLTGSNLAEAAARHLLASHAGSLPDLSNLVVLVPNHRAGRDFARALALQSSLPTLIPPRITPLKSWALEYADLAAEPHFSRLARLHGVLRKQDWLGHVDRWALANELLALCDELSAARPGANPAGVIRAQGRAAQERETALVEAVWQAMNNSGTDPQANYAQALQAIDVYPPLYGFSLGPLTVLEKTFLQRYAEHTSVRLFSLDTKNAAPVFVAAWSQQDQPLRERAARLARDHACSPIAELVHLSPAPHLEAEARAVAAWVAGQLQAGRTRIALIALDREAARRTRALLERMGVLADDETGWTLSTTAAAAIIDRWLTCLASDFPHTELLDLLKSPFVLGEPGPRQDAVLALEAALRRHGIGQGLNEMLRLTREITGCDHLLDPLAKAHASFNQARAPLSAWQQRLLGSLDTIHATPQLERDAAGAEVLSVLRNLQQVLADDAEKYSFAEWRRWLDLALESHTFIDRRIDSPIVLTSLAHARGRQFDAVAFIGADSGHLPAPAPVGLCSQSVRAQWGLPTTEEAAGQTTQDLLELCMQGPVLFSWQAWHEDEPNPASPFVLRLQALHQAAWNADLPRQAPGLPPTRQQGEANATCPPSPAVPPFALPRRYSASAYQTLLDCPYRFFTRHVLNVRELDEADDPLDKSDYGNALHTILKRFHDSAPPHDSDAAQIRLTALSAEEFARYPAWTATAWQAKWQKIQPAYIEAWQQWVQAGWQYQRGEAEFEKSTRVEVLGEVLLYGRPDRVDQQGTQRVVIDYKTTDISKLRKHLQNPGEHIQLPFYAWLADASAGYWPLNKESVKALELDGETDVASISQRLLELLTAITAGATLPANATDDKCRYCEARGMCRRDMWHG